MQPMNLSPRKAKLNYVRTINAFPGLASSKTMAESNTNNFPYLPHTDNERQEMLDTIGIRAFEDLIKHIPSEVRAAKLDLPDGLNELELREKVASLAAKNKPASQQASFLGGGSYRRFVP